ncbi:SNF2 family N-terminal domain-containing protein [Phycomyces nitens]|nr:SNF2 family N-terminal domain-containing protein [Phycomyces nitens]
MSQFPQPIKIMSPLNMLPGSFTKEKLNNLLQRAKFLQAQGEKEGEHLELSQIMQFLRNLQNKQKKSTPVLSDDASTFSHNQLAALKYQIMAYKLISKNMPLSSNLQQAVLSPTTINLQKPNADHPSTETDDRSNTSKPNEPFASPYDMLKKTTELPTQASPRMLIPSITPLGMDSHTLITERERRVQARIQYRIHELEKIPSNLSDDLSRQINALEEDIKANRGKSLKLKAVIELKALRLLSKQRKLREEIMTGMTTSTTLATSADRLAYRRMKKQSLREARMTEKIERQQRIDREQKEKQKHLDYLQTICDHGRNMLNVHGGWKAKQEKLGRAVLQFHQHIEKEELKKAERVSKERIRALKNDDEEAYMKLIDEAKDTRLTQLLKQTGSFLESLTKAVMDQQNDPMHQSDHMIPMPEPEETDENAAKVDYFQVTHRIKEEVCQPSILVGGKLKDYQIKGLQWMVSLYNNHLNGILADEMGLGKTIQTISLITYLIEHKRQNGPFLIIVPLSTLTNWTLEFEKWAPSVNKIVYKGPPMVRKNLQADIRHNDFQVLLTTFEYIIKDRPILSKIKWLHMIVDEGHRMKNTNSKLTIVLRQYYHTRYRLILTGTPLQNNLPELWALLNFILPKIFKSVKSFEEWFNTPFSNQGVQDKIDLNEEEQLLIIKRLHKVLRPFLLRRLKKDVESELPDKIERVIKCKLSALQLQMYTQMKKNRMLYTTGGNNGKTTIKGLNNKIMQLRKICNHPFVFEEVESAINPNRQSNDLLFRTSGKFELLDRMLPKLEKTGHRVLIFFQMTQIMSIMEDFLTYRGFSYLRLDGSTKADDRSELLRLFNAPGSPYFIFLLSTRAGGLGLNLQTADTVVIFDSDWNPHQDLQAQDRAHRIGQTKEVRIFRLISTNSVEESILARANYKLDIDGKVIQAGKFDNRSTEEDRETFLRSLLEDKADEQEEEEEDLDDEELNEMLKRSDEEGVLFQKMDEEREKRELEQWRQKGNRGRKPERLIQEKELPDVYQEDLIVADNVPLELGRGQRVKDSIRYDDGLTEDQWVNALEDEDVDLEDLISRKEAKKRRAQQQQHQQHQQQQQQEDKTKEPSPEIDSNRKRGRPRRGEVEPRNTKRPKKATVSEPQGPDPVPAEMRKKMTQVFETCYAAVEGCVVEDEDGIRSRSQLFMDLVSKRDYPMYYSMIKQPISLTMIKKRIRSCYYETVEQFVQDVLLLFDNARTFNEEGSFVYEDANEMEKVFKDTLGGLYRDGQFVGSKE